MGAATFAGWRIFRPAGGRLTGFIFALLLLVGPLARAADRIPDITTRDGKTYHECELEKIEPDALRIMYADGAARIPYEMLPEALQKKYFDPEKIAAYRQQFAQQQQEKAAKVAEAERIREEAAAKAAEQERQHAAELQREVEAQQAIARTKEELRLTAERHKKQIATGLVIAAGFLMFFLYFLPTIIARHKANGLAVFVFNLFFGWSGIGWIIALIWACTKDSAMDVLARQQLDRLAAQPPPPPPPPSGGYVANQLPQAGQNQLPPPSRQLDDGNRYLP